MLDSMKKSKFLIQSPTSSFSKESEKCSLLRFATPLPFPTLVKIILQIPYP